MTDQLETPSVMDARVDLPVPRALVVIAITVLGAVAVFMAATIASIYGDGSFYLLTLIRDGSSFDVPGRELLVGLRDLPVLVALKLGETNTHTLGFVQSVSYILLPAGVWALSIVLAARDRVTFALVALACAFCFGIMIFFSVSELVLGIALVAFVSTLLAQTRPWTITASVTASAAMVILVAAHESIALCAFVVFAHAVVRVMRSQVRIDRIGGFAVAALAVASVAWSIWTWVNFPNDNSHSFMEFLLNLQPRSSALLLVLTVIVAVFALTPWVDRQRMFAVVLLLPVVTLAAVCVISAGRASPHLAYDSRGYAVLAIVGLQLSLLVMWLRRRRSGKPRRNPPTAWQVAVPVGFLVLMLAIPTSYTLHWRVARDQFRHVVVTKSGLQVAPAVLPPDALFYSWSWADPSLSVVLRQSPGNAIVYWPGFPVVPFEPATGGQQLPPEFSWR